MNPDRATDEVVQRQPVPRPLEPLAGSHDLLAGLHRFDELDDRALPRQDQVELLQQDLARGVDEADPVTQEHIQPEPEQGGVQHLEGGLVEVVVMEGVVQPGAEQQLVAVHLLPAIEDRLAGDEDVGAGGVHGGARQSGLPGV